MTIRNHLIRAALIIGPLAQLVTSEQSPASLGKIQVKMHVMIDGIDFGAFERPKNIDLPVVSKDDPMFVKPAKNGRVTLQRDFVTDRSLYQWTANASQVHVGPRDIELVSTDQFGREVSHITLKYCQPLSWSVEAANPAMGGYHERVDFAIQGVERVSAAY